MSLLDNELVKRYFSPKPGGYAPGCNPIHLTALAVLEAMSAEVKEGQLYLAVSEYGSISGPHKFIMSDHHKYHGQWLVLPAAFQPSPQTKATEEYRGYCCTHGVPCPNQPTPEAPKCGCSTLGHRDENVGCECPCHADRKPDEVEAVIKWIVSNEVPDARRALECNLRELVSLVKRTGDAGEGK